MKLHLFCLYAIVSCSILDIYLGICHKMIRMFMNNQGRECDWCGECYKMLRGDDGYLPKIANIEYLLMVMSFVMVIIARLTYIAMRKKTISKNIDAIICMLSMLQFNVAIIAVGSFLQSGGWDLIKTMVPMYFNPNLCDGFRNKRTNNYFLSLELLTLEVLLSLAVLVFSQILPLAGMKERYAEIAENSSESNDSESGIYQI